MDYLPEELELARVFFEENGFVKFEHALPNYILGKIQSETDNIMRNVSNLPKSHVWLGHSKDKTEVVQRICWMNQHSPAIKDLGESSVWLKDMARKLLGGQEATYADGTRGDYGAMLIIKDTNNFNNWQDLGWHQDTQFTSHLPIHPFINIGIYLDDADEFKGQLVVLPRSQKFGAQFHKCLLNTVDYHDEEVGVIAKAGDIIVHHSKIWHCSRRIVAGFCGLRRVLYFKFYPMGV